MSLHAPAQYNAVRALSFPVTSGHRGQRLWGAAPPDAAPRRSLHFDLLTRQPPNIEMETTKLQNMPNNLSGGQQQRVAIARALITKPAIVLADEPTGNLDSKTSADVLGLLKRTSTQFNQTIVMITHNNEIAQLADRIVRIEDGKIVG